MGKEKEVLEQEKNNIVLNFGNIVSELEEKNLKLLKIKDNNGLFVVDCEGNLYGIEPYYAGGYLDRFIGEKFVISFERMEQPIRDFEDWRKEFMDASWVKSFIERVVKIEYPNFTQTHKPFVLPQTTDHTFEASNLLKYEDGKIYFDSAEIFLNEYNYPCVQFPGEETPRILRDNISNILAGDAFIVGEAILVADDTAYMLTGDWRVDDVDGAGGWREGDIDCDTVAVVEKYLRLMKGIDKPKNALNMQIQDAAARASSQHSAHSGPSKIPER